MHFAKYKKILSSNNVINVYRGCTHGCIYCDSRSHCYQINHKFEDIEVKEDAPLQFRDQLRNKRKKCMVIFGAMCDSYMPIEKELKYTRECLKAIYDFGFGVSITTKSDLILRDIDILKKISNRSKCVVNITLTTFNDELCSVLEPNVCNTSRRIEVLKELNDNGITTVVWLTPILPFINDTESNIYNLIQACDEAKVYGIVNFGMGLTLRDGNREYFYKKLDKYFPTLKERYINCFGNNYEILSFKNEKLMNLFRRECNKHHIVCNQREVFDFLYTYEDNKEIQLSLF